MLWPRFRDLRGWSPGARTERGMWPVKRVLLLATTTGYQIRSFGEAAQKLGVQLVFATDRCDQLENPWWDEAIPIRFHEEARSLSTILAAVGGQPPAGVLAVGDRPTHIA